MNTLVVYDSQFGNTEKVARVVGTELEAVGTVQVRPVAGADVRLGDEVDLLVVGGPTQGHGMTKELRAFVDAVGSSIRPGTRAAAFDTRIRMPAVLTGSAAKGIARRLRRSGVSLVTPPESFFVTRDAEPELEEGELGRAQAWAAAVKATALPV